ncbi:sigma-70 family RNA polymerase sigma factor [Saltatorellus ferox]|uniref:sigma-70 family RNA polymerase sigma factor n=1 Tax=Saltatorellus ferox TaxID=2528018 RepID=UPI003AF37A13
MKDSATRAYLRYCRHGDGRALARLFDAVAPDLLGVARHMAPDIASAEDLVQSTFVIAIEGASRFDPTREVKPWLYGILAREAARLRRSTGRTFDEGRLRTETVAPAPLESAEQAETNEVIQRTLEGLPPHYREVLCPFLVEGQSAPEIALRLGGERSAGHVRMQIGRGLKLLRERLPRGLALSAGAAAAMPRGTAAVRAAVLEHGAARGTIAASTLHVPLLLGFIAMGKVTLLLLVAAIAATAFSILRSDPSNASLLPAVAPADGVRAQTPALAAVDRSSAGRTPGELFQGPAPGAQPMEAAVAPPVGAPEAPAPPAATLLLTVTDREGIPVEGAEVRVWHNEQPIFGPQREELDRWAPPGLHRSDAAGLATCDDLQPGQSVVLVSAPGMATKGPFRTPRIRAGDSCTLQVELAQEAILRGRVTDDQGQPIAGATVRTQAVSTETDADGEYELRSLGRDDRGESFVEAPCMPRLSQKVSLRHGQTTVWDPVLEAPATLGGRLIDHRGRGLSGWWIRAHFQRQIGGSISTIHRARHSDFALAGGSVQTDEFGDFTLEGVVGEDFVLSAQATESYDENEQLAVFRDVQPGDMGLVLEVPEEPACAIVTGTLAFADGTTPQRLNLHLDLKENLSSNSKRRTVRLGADGDFRLRLPAAGRAVLSAGEFWEGSDHGQREITLVPGETLDLGTWTLPSPGQLDLQPEYLADAETEFGIWYVKQLGRGQEKRGQFGVDQREQMPMRIPPGTYEIRQADQDRSISAPEQVEVRAGETSVARPRIQKAPDMRLAFSDETGAPFQGSIEVRVEHLETGTLLSSIRVDASRGCSLPLDPVPMLISAESHDGRSARAVFQAGSISRSAPIQMVLK